VEGYITRMAADGMCDQRLHNDVLGDVEHVNQLSDNIGALFMQDGYSDVTLVVEEQRFVAHKVVLAARSEYFRFVAFEVSVTFAIHVIIIIIIIVRQFVWHRNIS